MKDALRIYGVDGHFLEGIRSFYKDVRLSVCVEGERSESFSVGMGVRWVGDVTMASE